MGEALQLLEQTLREARKRMEVEPKGSIPASVFHGRFSIPHEGHIAMMKEVFKGGKKNGAKKLVVAIVMGKNTSKDKDKNPTSFIERKSLINKALQGIPHEVVQADLGFLGEIINKVRKAGYEPVLFGAGPDRVSDYEKHLDKYGEEWDVQADVFSVKVRLAQGASATAVREAIRSNDRATFEKFMSKELHGEWDNLKKILGV